MSLGFAHQGKWGKEQIVERGGHGHHDPKPNGKELGT